MWRDVSYVRSLCRIAFRLVVDGTEGSSFTRASVLVHSRFFREPSFGERSPPAGSLTAGSLIISIAPVVSRARSTLWSAAIFPLFARSEFSP